MKRSVNAWAVGADYGFEETFAKVKAAGFEAIELNLDADGAHALTMETTAADLQKIVEISKKFELPVSGISTSIGGNIGSADEAERQAAVDVVKKQLFLAKHLGASAILAVPGAGNTPWGEAHEICIEAYRSLTPVIEDTGILVGMEHVWNGFFLSPRDLAYTVDEIGSDFVGVYFDIANCADRSKSEDWITFLGERIKRVHIKNFNRKSVFEFAFPLLFEEGTIDWVPVMAALRKIGYEGPLTAEFGAPEGDPSENLIKSADAIRRIQCL
ncbi:MAG: sugar phosphate isomerase/epimerase [Clostridia bacterium]|nr:sugar phosphate isomerase/epimerase [Clostridia bacterium]